MEWSSPREKQEAFGMNSFGVYRPRYSSKITTYDLLLLSWLAFKYLSVLRSKTSENMPRMEY